MKRRRGRQLSEEDNEVCTETLCFKVKKNTRGSENSFHVVDLPNSQFHRQAATRSAAALRQAIPMRRQFTRIQLE